MKNPQTGFTVYLRLWEVPKPYLQSIRACEKFRKVSGARSAPEICELLVCGQAETDFEPRLDIIRTLDNITSLVQSGLSLRDLL